MLCWSWGMALWETVKTSNYSRNSNQKYKYLFIDVFHGVAARTAKGHYRASTHYTKCGPSEFASLYLKINSRVKSNPLAINISCTVCLKIISETCWTRGKFLRAPNLIRIMWQIQWRSVLRRYQTPEQLSCTLSTFQILFYNYELPTSCNLLRSSRVLSDLVSWNFLQISFSSFSQ